jgi:hypothetical protein
LLSPKKLKPDASWQDILRKAMAQIGLFSNYYYYFITFIVAFQINYILSDIREFERITSQLFVCSEERVLPAIFISCPSSKLDSYPADTIFSLGTYNRVWDYY